MGMTWLEAAAMARDRLDLAKERGFLAEALKAGEIRYLTQEEAVVVPPAKMSPQAKLDMLKAMGFTAQGSDHAPDCPSVLASGYRCNCVPDPVAWYAPDDVAVHMHDTYAERRAKSQARIAKEDE